MRSLSTLSVALLSIAAGAAAQQPAPQMPAPNPPLSESPYKVIKTAKVGGEGGTDYIYADVAGRKLYIPRGGTRADTVNNRPAIAPRITVFDLETLAPLGEIATMPNSQGNGAVVDAKSGHGFASSRPAVTMFDTKTMQVLKAIPIDSGFGPDGIFFDDYSGRVYIGSHPTKDVMVIEGKDGTVVGRIDLGGTPEQNVSDGKGTLYFMLQDAPGSIAVVDTKSMKTTAHYAIGDHGGCNGLAIDAKNGILFTACSRTGAAPVQGGPPPTPAPAMVILNAKTGKILAELPLAGGSDGAVFNPATMEAFSAHGNGTMTVVKEKSPTSFEVEQNLSTMNGARTLTLDTKTGHIFVMSVEREPAPPPVPGQRPQQARAIPGSFTIVEVGKP